MQIKLNMIIMCVCLLGGGTLEILRVCF